MAKSTKWYFEAETELSARENLRANYFQGLFILVHCPIGNSVNYSRKTTIKTITPECLKRSQNKDLKKCIKSTEELEMEKIISLQKQLKEHCRLSKISMAKAISRQSVQSMKENISKNRKRWL